MLSALLRFAKKAGLVERNVVRDLDRDDRPGTQRLSEPRYLSSAELARLLAELGDVFRPVILLCSLAGLRISEALGLHWGDVRFGARRSGSGANSTTTARSARTRRRPPRPRPCSCFPRLSGSCASITPARRASICGACATTSWSSLEAAASRSRVGTRSAPGRGRPRRWV
jgi:hypothetical protein